MTGPRGEQCSRDALPKVLPAGLRTASLHTDSRAAPPQSWQACLVLEVGAAATSRAVLHLCLIRPVRGVPTPGYSGAKSPARNGEGRGDTPRLVGRRLQGVASACLLGVSVVACLCLYAGVR